ncbi:MAG TPA: zf-TFIIB domain-containing protein, partial [Anaeromyxobacter sp.]|nr:zf-TFIIB domain-containing protein [Anaeromyxobacter sp.]
STSEDEFFAKEDVEKKRKLSLQLAKQLAADEKKRLRDLHHLHCPKCGMKMEEVRFRNLDVDVCFSCNGIFLDQGELEHLERPESRGVMSAILNWFRPEVKG